MYWSKDFESYGVIRKVVVMISFYKKQKFILQNQAGSVLGLWGQSAPKPRVPFW